VTGLLLQVLMWIRENPATFLTGLMAFVTALYARATTKYVEVAANQFAAQIEPEPAVSLQNCNWRSDDFRGTVVITTARNTLVLEGGDICLRCEHGNIRLAIELREWDGHTLMPQQRLPVDVEVPFEHHGSKGHHHAPSVEGFLVYRDARHIASYRCIFDPGGVIRRYKLEKWGVVEKLKWGARLQCIKVLFWRRARRTGQK